MADEYSFMQCVTKSEFNMAGLSSSFAAMNGSGFSDSAKILKIYNPSTTIAIEVSLDGVTAHDFIPPLSALIVDFQTNHYDGGTYGTGTLVVRKGQIIFGRVAPNPTYLQIIGYR